MTPRFTLYMERREAGCCERPEQLREVIRTAICTLARPDHRAPVLDLWDQREGRWRNDMINRYLPPAWLQEASEEWP